MWRVKLLIYPDHFRKFMFRFDISENRFFEIRAMWHCFLKVLSLLLMIDRIENKKKGSYVWRYHPLWFIRRKQENIGRRVERKRKKREVEKRREKNRDDHVESNGKGGQVYNASYDDKETRETSCDTVSYGRRRKRQEGCKTNHVIRHNIYGRCYWKELLRHSEDMMTAYDENQHVQG